MISFTAILLLALIATATAFVLPQMGPVMQRNTFSLKAGKYDGQEWNDAAKQDVLSMYDPSQPWSETNFDPFKRDKTGNACDASGYYPGDKNYKDPIRPQMSFEEYMKSRQQGGN
mmetsp:Transcript_9412/g.12319  ORF Transcript_9412/g.12319 Transcript_9412/m.12319 type:complete len:115 (-) Transcript_9412:482-826(-)